MLQSAIRRWAATTANAKQREELTVKMRTAVRDAEEGGGDARVEGKKPRRRRRRARF